MQRENKIPKSSLTSAVATDLPDDQAASDKAMEDHVEKDPLIASGLGLIKVDGIDKRYVGKPPALDDNPELPSGLRITADNSTFIPLWEVPFSNSIEIKDPTTGEFYYPPETARSWTDCEHNGVPLVPPLEEPEPPPENGGGEAPVAEERSFAGDGTAYLTIDLLSAKDAITGVAVEGDAYPVPAYEVGASDDQLHTTDESPWQTGVNVLVTAVYADQVTPARAGDKAGAVDDARIMEDAKSDDAKKKKDDEPKKKDAKKK